MTTISELREAIRYYTANRNMVGILVDDAANTIADCFTLRDPITRERLEELGPDENGGGILRFGTMKAFERNHVGRANAGFHVTIIEANKEVSVRPQPQTMGDLYRLLEQLTRE
jgi:hypothetical protein